jgi:magnesium transporter
MKIKKKKSVKRHSQKAGMPPGTLMHIGERMLESVRITILDYDQQHLQEKQVEKIEDCFELKSTPTVSWINIDGLHNIEVIEKIGKNFDLHPLVLEDILNTGQRPKFEDMDSYLFIVLKMLTYDEQSQSVQYEQVSLVLRENMVISFQENVGDVFENIRKRIRDSKGRIRNMGADYLLYVLLDAIVDNYFAILEKLGEKIELMEEMLISNPTEKTLAQIHSMKRELISLRKSVWPLRELISNLQRCESEIIKQPTEIYLADVYDHTIQVIDTVETFRDMLSGMLDIYLSSLSNKMNSVMKVLTIIATIFIPLTFVAGIYGMNFKYMPELEWKLGYAMAWGIMLAISVLMLLYFKRKKWL